MGIWNLTKIDVVTDIRSSERTYKRHGVANCPLSFVLQHPLYPFPFPSPSFTEQRSFRLAVLVTVIFISTSIIPFSSIKMRFFALVAALVSAVAAETFTVIVGGNSTITYNPTSVNATNGDVIQFQFVSKNHTLTQSSFAAPCTPLAGGVDSGFQAVATNATTFPVWSFTLTNTSAPLWFYCAQVGHCANDGMVFAVNPTAAKSFEAFQAAALATGTNSTTTNSTASAATSGTSTASTASGSTVASASAAVASQSAVGAATTANGATALASSAIAGLVAVFGVGIGLLL